MSEMKPVTMHHIMKAYMGIWSKAAFIVVLALDGSEWSVSHFGTFITRKDTVAPTGCDERVSVWSRRQRKKSMRISLTHCYLN